MRLQGLRRCSNEFWPGTRPELTLCNRDPPMTANIYRSILQASICGSADSIVLHRPVETAGVLSNFAELAEMRQVLWSMRCGIRATRANRSPIRHLTSNHDVPCACS